VVLAGFGTVSTIKAAARVAAGQAAAAGVVAAAVAALTEGVLQAMLLTKLHKTLVIMLMAGVLLGGVLLLASLPPASGQTPANQNDQANAPARQASKWAGEWLFDGKEDQPCAIFQQGRVLLLVNERGEMVTGKIRGENKLTWGWDENALVGELKDEGKTISWANDTTWKRP
jgi:hypothetical protein